MAENLPIGKPVQDASVDPSKAGNATNKLMSPNAKEDPETVTGDNPLKAWKPGGSRPKGPFGQQGKNF